MNNLICKNCGKELNDISRETVGTMQQAWEIKDNRVVSAKDDYIEDGYDNTLCGNCNTPVTKEQEEKLNDIIQQYNMQQELKLLKEFLGEEEFNRSAKIAEMTKELNKTYK